MDLEKFWLGNVNEKGEIDQEGYDEDTKDGLLRTTKNENLVKGAVSEQDTAAAKDDDFEMPTDTVPKAQDAKDFSKEEEVADDDEPSAYHIQKAQQLLAGKKAAAAKSKDDDYDEYDEEEDEEDEEAPRVPPAPEPAAAKAKQDDGEAAQPPADDGDEGADLPPAVPTTPTGRAKSTDKDKDQFMAGVGLRKRGLLCLSEMFVGPSNEPRIAKGTRKAAASSSLQAKIEVLSDDEDKFVDEAARRAAAAASLRLRDSMAVDAESDEEEEEGVEGDEAPQRKEAPQAVEEDREGVDEAAAAEEEAAEAMQDDAALGMEGGGAAALTREQSEYLSKGQTLAERAVVTRTLPLLESQAWEDDIIWGGDDDDDEGDGAKAESEKEEDEEEDMFDDDEEDFEKDDDGFGGGKGGGGMLGEEQEPVEWMESMLGEGGGGGRGGGDQVMAPDEGDAEVVPAGGGSGKAGDGGAGEEGAKQQRAGGAKYFAARDEANPSNAVRIGEYNYLLENGSWLDLVLWHDQDRKRVEKLGKEGAAERQLSLLRRPHRAGGLSGSAWVTPLAPHKDVAQVHDCVPPWWSRPDGTKQLSVALLAERLNISNDDYYQGASGTKARIKLGRPTVVHAPAVKFTKRLVTQSGLPQRAKLFRQGEIRGLRFSPIVWPEKNKDRKTLKGAEEKIMAMKKPRDVTCVDSRNLLVEYYEDHPPLTSNTGMAAKLRHYYRIRSEQPAPTIPSDHLADGKAVALDPQQDSPFYAEIPEGSNSYVSAFENNMCRVPVAKHHAESTDFMVIKSGDKYYIREVDSLYAAGQSHPFQRVPAPTSKEHTAYIRRHCMSFIYNRLKDGGQLQTHEVFDEFPETSEAIIRRQLKDCAQFQREGGEGGHWTLKDGFDMPKEYADINDTPETSCMYESLRAGQLRLKNMGITRLTTLEGYYSTAVQEIMKDRNLDSVIRNGAQCVQEILRLAPWNLSKDFVQAGELRMPLNLHTLVASSTARKAAMRNDPAVKQQDPKDKKVQTDYQRRKQLCFNEMLEALRAKDRASSSDEEDKDQAELDELLDGGSRPPAPGKRMKKVTIAHRWRKETKQGESTWKCETIRNPEEVAKIVNEKRNLRDTLNTTEGGDERAKADARREKKRLQEQKRRQTKKMQKLGIGSHVMIGDDLDDGPRPTERIGKIKISKEAFNSYKQNKKRDAKALPDHLQGKAGRGVKRRRLDPSSDLRGVFERAFTAMWQHPKGIPFRAPVDSRSNPDYRKIVKKPIDLNIIRIRNDEGQYNSKIDFMHDVHLMVSNCKLYCETREPKLVSDVYELRSICEEKLNEAKSTIMEAESMIQLAKLLESEILMKLIQHTCSEHFRVPVNMKDYTQVVKQPMDLSAIRQKVQNYSYSSREGMMADIRLIRDNCHAFCTTRFPNLPPLADKLMSEAQKLMEKNAGKLKELEQGVGTWAQLTHSKVNTPGTSYPGTPGGAGRGSMPTTPGGMEMEQVPEDDEGGGEDLAGKMMDEMEEAPEDGDAGDLAEDFEDAMDEADDDDGDGLEAEGGMSPDLGEGMMAPTARDDF